MFMALFIISLLFSSVDSAEQCDQGYLSTVSCSFDELKEHIFSGSTDNWVDDFIDYDDDDYVSASIGYNVKNILIPSEGNAYVFAKTNGIYSNYFLPNNDGGRENIVWSSLFNTSSLTDLYYTNSGLFVSMRNVPFFASLTTDEPNEAIYGYQQFIMSDMLNSEYKECETYAPNSLVGNYSSSNSYIYQQYSNKLADAVFICLECDSKSALFFDGALWTAKAKKYCYDPDCAYYPYACTFSKYIQKF